MKRSLTHRQADVLTFLRTWFAQSPDVGPSMDDIIAGVGLSSRGNASALIGKLEERGYVVRTPHQARSLRLIEPPAPARTPDLAEAARALLDSIIDEDPERTGTAIVSTAALGDLDLALAEMDHAGS